MRLRHLSFFVRDGGEGHSGGSRARFIVGHRNRIDESKDKDEQIQELQHRVMELTCDKRVLEERLRSKEESDRLRDLLNNERLNDKDTMIATHDMQVKYLKFLLFVTFSFMIYILQKLT